MHRICGWQLHYLINRLIMLFSKSNIFFTNFFNYSTLLTNYWNWVNESIYLNKPILALCSLSVQIKLILVESSFSPILEVALLYLGLPRGVEVVCIWCSRVDVLGAGEHVQDVRVREERGGGLPMGFGSRLITDLSTKITKCRKNLLKVYNLLLPRLRLKRHQKSPSMPKSLKDTKIHNYHEKSPIFTKSYLMFVYF